MRRENGKQTVMEYVIPPNVPIKESKRVVVEVLDDFLNKVFGFHFLEPFVSEKTITKVVPALVSRRGPTAIVQPAVNLTNQP